MGDQYDIDDTCSRCGETASFSIKLVEGHKRKHRVANCSHCGMEEVLTACDCISKVEKLVSERPCKVEGCGSHIFLDEKLGWLCIAKKHPQGDYGSK